MTKRHFIILADRIRQANAYSIGAFGNPDFTREAIGVLADFYSEENPRFNRQLWFDYIAGKCGPSGGTLLPK